MSAVSTTPPPAAPREVASGLVNLGNSCYMNVVLQALAHAPELMLALDCESHCKSCPVFQANVEKQRNSPSPPEVRTSGVRKSRRTTSPTSPRFGSGSAEVYCTLCQLELHLKQVHVVTQNVAPHAFVHGFLDHVAPWFKLGVQEDSHEFLRLLIEAIQKSCDTARKMKPPSNKAGPMVPSKNDESAIATEPTTTLQIAGESCNEYPFRLFRGTVESNVVCDACGATSTKIDPIEDIGLEVSANSGSTLSDVHSAFSTFSRQECLEGYKCDKCNIMGNAKKQSRLASIPPILTLHLKRFRYGSDGKPMEQRRGRELHQLLGASGSAKIEGHVKFLEIFDLKSFLTESLQAQHKSMFCRLFAVIVHAGKNSHSGHYIAFVRNLSKNEWWKMDDSRVSRTTSQEVLSAEAYMLFYRVVDHPISKEFREKSEQPIAPKVVADEEEDEKLILSPQDVEPTAVSLTTNKRKRPAFDCGEDWAKHNTRLPAYCAQIFRRAEEFISDHIEFKPEFFKLIMEEAEAGKKNGPSAVCVDHDVQGNVTEKFRDALLELFYKVASRTGDVRTFLKNTVQEKTKSKPIIVPVVDSGDLL